jgi:DNA adenine methylase
MRYHGGKWRLAKWIISHFPEHRIYTETFGGAASVLMQKPRSYAEVYNDLDGEIVNLFRVLRNPAQARELLRQIELTPFAREEFELTYLTDGDPIEQARRTVARSFMGFGSAAASGQPTGFRGDSNRSGTTPAHDWRNYPAAMAAIVDRVSGVVIENKSAEEVVLQYDSPDTLHYVDPPYVHETRSQKKRTHSAYRFEMTDSQHRDLAEILHNTQGYVVLSGYACPLYDELYTDWYRVDRVAHADGARDRIESLWLNPRTADIQAQMVMPL